MKMKFITLCSLAVLSLSACQTSQWGQKQGLGTGAGALAGGLLGSQVGGGSGRLWATGAGVLLGAFVGNEIGASLDSADRYAMQQAQQSALNAPVGETITWNNPDSGHYGSYTPVREGMAASGSKCREYEQTIYIDGHPETAYGTACKRPDGTWQIVNG